MNLISFAPDHLKELPNYAHQESLVNLDDGKFFVGDHAFSVLKGNRIIGCIGLAPCNQYRAVAWAVFPHNGKNNDFVTCHMASRWLMRNNPFRRLESYVDPRSERAMRWIKLLGFEIEIAYIPFFYPDGGGTSVWSYYPVNHNA